MSFPSSEPPPDAGPTPTGSCQRDVLAVAGLTAHRALRYNVDGSPHAGQLARFAKGLAAPDVHIDALLGEARRRGLLGAIGDAYAPIAGALLRFSAEIDDESAAWLPASGWTPVEAVERAVVSSMIADGYVGTVQGTATAYQGLADAVRVRVKSACGVEVVEKDGQAWNPAAIRWTAEAATAT